jgi:hypothetical protein
MGPLAIKLGLGAISRLREPARVLQAGGEHRGDEGHGGSSIVAMAPSLSLPRIRPGPLATVRRLAGDGARHDDGLAAPPDPVSRVGVVWDSSVG